MLIAIEGPDCSGKTTLFNALRGLLDARFVERLPLAPELFPHMNAVEARQIALWEALYDDSRTYISDRSCFVTGPVYNSIHSRPDLNFAPHWYQRVVVAYMNTHETAIRKRLGKRGDELFDIGKLKDTIYAYSQHVPKFRHFFCTDVDSFFANGAVHGIRRAAPPVVG